MEMELARRLKEGRWLPIVLWLHRRRSGGWAHTCKRDPRFYLSGKHAPCYIAL